MRLPAGTKLGQYEIVSPLGAGGMGEVYRARDSKLKRDVALKILPETFARDPERMARFHREAELLASLNHPNIATIYGFEDNALVMELIEGEILKGPLPLESALLLAADCRSPRIRARTRRHSSRPETRQRQGDTRWRREGARLRTGEGD